MIYILGANSSIFEMIPLVNANNSTSTTYNGEFFALKETIYFVFNYRQELFSSLYLENEYSGKCSFIYGT